MIHVTIFCNEDRECVGFQTEGHAEYADPGEDIICAAVSVLVINTINSIETFAVLLVQSNTLICFPDFQCYRKQQAPPYKCSFLLTTRYY